MMFGLLYFQLYCPVTNVIAPVVFGVLPRTR